MDALARQGTSILAQQWLWDRVGDGGGTVYFTPPALVNSAHKLTSRGHCNELYTPCRVLHYCGKPEETHARMVGKESQWVNGNVSQCFLAPLTLARGHHLPPRSHKRLIVSWACRSLGVKWVITFHSHLQTACTTWVFPTANQWIGAAVL